jgi:hypothetical protein
VCITATAGPGGTHHPVLTNYFVDDGSRPLGLTCNFKQGLPELWCHGGASDDPITMYDIYEWALAGAPGRVLPSINPDFVDFDDWKKTDMFWVVHASLNIGWDGSANQTTYFSHLKAGGIIIYGRIDSTPAATVQFGEKINLEDGDLRQQPVLMVFGSSLLEGGALRGNVKLYGLSVVKGGRSWGSYYYYGWNNHYYVPRLDTLAGTEVLDCDFPEKASGLELFGYGTAKGCRFGGVRANTNWLLEQPKITLQEGLGLRHNNNTVTREALTTWTTYDLVWRTTLSHILIDCTFRSQAQTDNRPWIFLAYTLGLGGSLTFKHSFRGQVRDQAGGFLVGAQVTITDVLDNVVFTDVTDSNGEFDAGDLTARVLEPTSKVVGVGNVAAAHEDTHVANGWLTRTMHTPHVLTIEAAGYQTYRDVLEIDRKMELEISLKPGPAYKPITEVHHAVC